MLSVREIKQRPRTKVEKFIKRNRLYILLVLFTLYLVSLIEPAINSTFSRIVYNYNQLDKPIEVTNYWGIFFISFICLVSILCVRKSS